MTNRFQHLGKWAFITTTCASLSASYSQDTGEFRSAACRLGIAAGVAAIAVFHARVEQSRGMSPLFARYVAVVTAFAIAQVVAFVPSIAPIVSGPTIAVGIGSMAILERLIEGMHGPVSEFVVSALVTCVVGGVWVLVLTGVALTLHATAWARDAARRATRTRATRRSEGRP